MPDSPGRRRARDGTLAAAAVRVGYKRPKALHRPLRSGSAAVAASGPVHRALVLNTN
jgi:hypothetical protein